MGEVCTAAVRHAGWGMHLQQALFVFVCVLVCVCFWKNGTHELITCDPAADVQSDEQHPHHTPELADPCYWVQ